MTNTLRTYKTNNNNLEVEVYENNGAVITKCTSTSGVSVYIQKKRAATTEFDLDVFCEPGKVEDEKLIRRILHFSIDAYFEDLATEKTKKARASIDNSLKAITDSMMERDDAMSRENLTRLNTAHMRMVGKIRAAGRDPKQEIKIYEMYVKQAQYGKSPQILDMLADKFGKTTNSLKVLMNWYNKHFLYASTAKRGFGETSWEVTAIYYAGNISNISYAKEAVLASIEQYKQHLN